MWSFGVPNLASIEALVEKEDTTVEAVLDDPAFMAAIRNGIPMLINFLVKPQNINRLLDLAFNGITPNTKLPSKTIRTAVSVLSTGISNMMNRLLNTPEFTARIIEFPNTEYSANPRACGHYSKIVESLARFSNGSFLSQLTGLKEFLTRNIKCIGLRYLLIFLCTDFPDTFKANEELFCNLAQSITEENGWYTITAIKEIIKSNSNFASELCNPQCITHLLTAASNQEFSPMLQMETFNLIGMLLTNIDQQPDIKEIISQSCSKYDFSLPHPQNVLAAALKVYVTDKPEILLKIFDNTTSTFLNDGIIKSFQAMSQDQIQDFEKTHNLTSQIIENFPKTKTNYHLTLLSNILNEKLSSKSEDWTNFVQKQLAERNHNREKVYGEKSSTSEDDGKNSDKDFSDSSSDDISSSSDSLDSSSDEDDDDDDGEFIITHSDDSSPTTKISFNADGEAEVITSDEEVIIVEKENTEDQNEEESKSEQPNSEQNQETKEEEHNNDNEKKEDSNEKENQNSESPKPENSENSEVQKPEDTKIEEPKPEEQKSEESNADSKAEENIENKAEQQPAKE